MEPIPFDFPAVEHIFREIHEATGRKFHHGCGSYLFDGRDYRYDGSTAAKQQLLARVAAQVDSVLEIGTYLGHSLLIMLAANPRLRVTTIDVDGELGGAAVRVLQRHFPQAKIDFRQGDSLAVIPQLTETFDLFHVDATHESGQVLREWRALLPLRSLNVVKVVLDDVDAIGEAAAQIKACGSLLEEELPSCRWRNAYYVVKVPKVVVVTGHVPIPGHPRSVEEYERLGGELAGLRGAPVRVLRCELSQCWLHEHVRDRAVDHAIDDNPAKNSLAYHVVQHQKTAWLAEAAAAEPDADVFVWIDYGVLHQRGVTLACIEDYVARLRCSTAVVIPGARSPRASDDWKMPDWRFCGSSLVVPRALVVPFHEAVCAVTLERLEEHGCVTWEVNDWAEVERRGAVPMRWYAADHDQTQFTNYVDLPSATPTPTIYVVSLPSAVDRRARVIERLRRQDLAHEVVDALERDAPEVDLYRDPAKDTSQDRGAAACFASHLRALRRFVASGADEAIVAEDDVVLEKNFAVAFAQLRSNIPDDCPLVCLGYLVWNWEGFRPAGRDPSRSGLRTMGADTWGAQMYWIRRSWAQECLRRLDRPFASIETLQAHKNSETITRDAGPRGGLVAVPPLAVEDLTGSLIVPEAGVANHPEALSRWSRATFDYDEDSLVVFRPAFSPTSCYLLRDAEEATYFASRGGAPEASLIDWATQIVKPGDTFIDVGAHVGTWAQHFAGKCRQVHAFEPQRRTFDRLREGVRLAGLSNVECHDCALGARGEVDLHVVSADGGGSTLHYRHELGAEIAVERVRAAQLDDFTFERVGLIKIDAEGAEADILRGAEKTLAAHDYPTLLLEAWLHGWYGDERQALIAQVEDLGYHVQPVMNCPETLLAEHPARALRADPAAPAVPSTLTLRSGSDRPLLGLVMIVRNEAKRIKEVLESYRSYVDAWTILDTGSTDGTQDLIRDVMAGVPGQLHEEPFVDFATSRNRALSLHGDETVFTIMPNGDVLSGGEALRSFLDAHRDDRAGAYRVRIAPGHYYHPLVMRTGAGWRYKWRTHECAVGSNQGAQIPGVVVVRDRDARTDAEWRARWERDLELLELDRRDDPSDPRPCFYLGQTYECLERYEEALDFFERRATMGGYFDEVFEAKLRVGRMKEKLGRPWGEVQQAYLEAFAHDPRRAEPLMAISDHWYDAEIHAVSRVFAMAAAQMPKPPTDLFLEEDIYVWKAADRAAISSYYAGHRDDARKFADQALRARPDDARLRANRAFSAHSARELLGAAARPILFSAPAGWHPSNPSICSDGGRVRCIVRTVNYKIVEGRYVTPPDDVVREEGPYKAWQVIRTRNFLLDLDSDLEVKRTVELVDVTEGRRTSYPVKGFEDARLFSWDGRWWATATVCDLTEEGRREIALLEIEDDGRVVRAEVLRGPWSAHAQKNWMPVVDGNVAKIVYAVDPRPTVLDLVDAHDPSVRRLSWHVAGRRAVGHELEASFDTGRLRGGSQGVRVEGGWLFVVHDVAFPGGSGRIYLHRFVLLDQHFQLISMTDPFYFERLGIEFCAGLARIGDKLVASYAVNDGSARLCVVETTAVLRALRTDFVI